jgi:hypothetical protein
MIDQVVPQKKLRFLLLAAGLIFLSYQGKTILTSLGNNLTLSAAQQMSPETPGAVQIALGSRRADFQTDLNLQHHSFSQIILPCRGGLRAATWIGCYSCHFGIGGVMYLMKVALLLLIFYWFHFRYLPLRLRKHNNGPLKKSILGTNKLLGL